ncbi:MAG: hypothetical protein M1608_13780 [Candidatus Omnitrophica bacterium]|nr:hypothetical protein [Candidatus Omnitrophota bacterium]
MKKLPYLILTVLLALMAGCIHDTAKLVKAQTAATTNAVALTEESRALTTGVVDALALAPTNPPTDLAYDMAKRDQQIEGVPTSRIDVPNILAGDQKAAESLEARYRTQESLIAERTSLEAKLKDAEAKLIDLGQKYEAEHNQTVFHRIWAWAIGTLGLGGIIALCIFFPAAIPLVGKCAAWLIGKIPTLANYLGVVGKDAFDAVVKGVGEFRAQWQTTDAGKALDASLAAATDQAHKGIIDASRKTLNV